MSLFSIFKLQEADTLFWYGLAMAQLLRKLSGLMVALLVQLCVL